MIDKERIPQEVLLLVEERLQGLGDEIVFPPPVFDAMQGEVVDFDIENGILRNRFPILSDYLNPYGSMQGGMVAAAIDNTIGPLSMLVSTPNVTRTMTVKYRKPVLPEMEHIVVTARFVEQIKRQLFFEAVVEAVSGEKLASAKATHWVVDLLK